MNNLLRNNFPRFNSSTVDQLENLNFAMICNEGRGTTLRVASGLKLEKKFFLMKKNHFEGWD